MESSEISPKVVSNPPSLIERIVNLPKTLFARFNKPVTLPPEEIIAGLKGPEVSPKDESSIVEPELKAINTAVAPTTNRGKLTRKDRIAAYEESKKAKMADISPDSQAPIPPPTKDLTKTDSFDFSGLPVGVAERIPTDETLLITKQDIPWIEQPEIKASLEQITLATTKREKFLFGDVIQSKKLTDAKAQLREKEERSCESILFRNLSELIQRGYSPTIKTVSGAITEKPIFSVGNPAGQRVYFIRFNRINNLPVIIRVAACNKEKQEDVLGVLTSTNRTRIKQLGKL